MYESEYPRVARINQLLLSRDHDGLERYTREEVGRHLLSDSALNAARLLKLPATVIYIASLAVANLHKAQRFQTWLAIYQSLARGVATPELMALHPKNPLKLVATAVLQRAALDPAALKKCHATLDSWFPAAELAVDQGRFDVLELMVRELVRRKLDVSDWLRLTKLLFNRHPHIAKSANIDALGHTYSRIRDNLLSRLPSVQTVRSRLALFASQSHFVSANYPAAIQAAQLASAPGDRIHAAFDIARAHCHAGELAPAIEWLDRLIALMCTPEKVAGYQAAKREREALLLSEQESTQPADTTDPEGLAEGVAADADGAADAVAAAEALGHQPHKVRFDPALAAGALVDLQNALAAVGQRAFLVSGTLLGYAREGQILTHDKDIDVGVIGWEDQFAVANALLQSGHFGIDSRRLRGQKTYHIPIRHLETGTSIDIFIYHAEGDKLVTGVESYFGYLQKFAFTPFGLKQVQFLGVDFYVPDDVERKLAENFGDWRQSDPDYISHLQSPSTVDVGGEVFQIVGRIRALESVRACKYEKLGRVIQLMELHRHRPGGMAGDTLAILRSVFESRPVVEVV